MGKKRGKKGVSCDSCGEGMKAIFGNLERTYSIFFCASCHKQARIAMA